MKKSSQNLLVIGGATQDIFMKPKISLSEISAPHNINTLELPLGKKTELSQTNFYTGGGGTNSAVSAARQNIQTSLLAAIGSDPTGVYIREQLASYQVDTSLLQVKNNHASGVSLIIPDNKTGENAILAYRGANEQLIPESFPYETLKNFKNFYITSLSNQASETLFPITKEIARLKKNGFPIGYTAINPGVSQITGSSKTGFPLLVQSLNNIDILLINRDEAELFAQKLAKVNPCYQDLVASFSPEIFITKLLSHYKLSVIIITQGKNGVTVGTHHELFSLPTAFDQERPPVDTLGAGDAFGSTLICSLIQGHTLRESTQRALINSAGVIGKQGGKAGLLTETEITEILAQKRKYFSQNHKKLSRQPSQKPSLLL